MAHIVKLAAWSKSRVVRIPRAITKELGWYVGDAISVSSQSGVIVLQKVTPPRIPVVTGVQDAEAVAE